MAVPAPASWKNTLMHTMSPTQDDGNGGACVVHHGHSSAGVPVRGGAADAGGDRDQVPAEDCWSETDGRTGVKSRGAWV